MTEKEGAARGERRPPKGSSQESSHGTRKYINFCPRPMPSDFILVLSVLDEQDRIELTRWLNDDAKMRIALCMMTTVDTPAELEAWRTEVRPMLVGHPRYLATFDRIYNGMWTHFLGGWS